MSDGLDRRLRKLQLQSQAAPNLPDQPRPDAYRRLEQRTVACVTVLSHRIKASLANIFQEPAMLSNPYHDSSPPIERLSSNF